MTAVSVGLLAHYVAGLAGPAAIVIGNGLALSSTAVVLQVNIIEFIFSSEILRDYYSIFLDSFHLNIVLF